MANKAIPRECRHCGTTWTRSSRSESLQFCPPCDSSMAWCAACSVTKPISEFSLNSSRRSGREHQCRDCAGTRKLKNRYGITREEYDELLVIQDGHCATCSTVHSPEQPLHVDHCHADLRVRGLLCSHCNTAIGLLREDLDVVQSVARYIASHQAFAA